MTPMYRRDFLKAGGAGLASLHLPLPAGHLRREFAGDGEAPTLVVLYLRGGMDALNVLVPYRDPRYYEIRPTLAVAPEDTEEEPGVIRLDGTFGLHPALAALMPFWKSGALAPIVNVGSPHPTRSHFDAQDFMEYAAPGSRTVRDGWLNRYLASTVEKASASSEAGERRLRALAMQGLLPRSLRGRHAALAVPGRKVLADEDMLALFEPLYRGNGADGADGGAVFETGRTTMETLALFRRLAAEGETGDGVSYPATQLARGLRTLARVIRSGARVIRAGAGLEVAAIDVAGWDTHAAQGRSSGAMPQLLETLATGLAAFMTDLGPLATRTVVLVMTEFGRTCRENGNYGTDHGHGGLMLLLGGGAKGGRIHGDWTGLRDKDLYQGRDLEVTTDFRDVLAEVLRHHFRFDVPKGFFPDYRAGRVKGLFG